MTQGTIRLVVALALVSAMGCRKPAPPPAPEPTPVLPVVLPLQVTAVTPSQWEPDSPGVAEIFGAGFGPGARVGVVGIGEASEVQVLSGNTLKARLPGLPEGMHDLVVVLPSGQQATLNSALSASRSELSCAEMVVHFEFDQSGLRPEDSSSLDSQMACFQQDAGQIAVDGHADERGTIEYNLALGQRRADSVRSRMISAGVMADRVSTVSYGEERPVDEASDEAAWAANRRAEIRAEE